MIHVACQVLQRKTEEAAMATKRLKDLLDSRKASRESSGSYLLECINTFVVITDS